MPLPAILGAVIPALAGSVINAIGQRKAGQEAAENEIAAIKARNKAVNRELRRQNRYTRKAADIFTDAIDIFEPEGIAHRQAKAAKTTGKYVVGNLPTEFGSIGTALAPQALRADEAAFVDRAAGENEAFGQGLADLLAHDQYLNLNQRALAKTGHKLNQISDFARGSAGVNVIEQAVAGKNAQQPPSLWGPVLQAAGTIVPYVAGQGGFNFSLPTNPLLPNSGTMY